MEWTKDALLASAEQHLDGAIPAWRFEDERLRRLVALAMASFACETMSHHLRDTLTERGAA